MCEDIETDFKNNFYFQKQKYISVKSKYNIAILFTSLFLSYFLAVKYGKVEKKCYGINTLVGFYCVTRLHHRI